MKRCVKNGFVFLVIAVFLFNMVACGNSETSTEGQQSAVNRGDKSIVFNVDWPAYIDPGVGSKSADSIAFVNLYDSLTFPDSDGTINPNVAESWDVNDDSTVYTFHLRDDVIFHSGNKLTASDVKYSMDRLLAIGEGYAYVFSGSVKSTEVLDEKTVRFTLANSSGTFPAMLIRLYILDEKQVCEHIDPSGSYGDNGDYGKNWLITNDAGSGPFQVKEMRTEESLIMERFTDYWKGWEEGAPEQVKMLGGVVGTTVRTMISRSELDITDDMQTTETLEALEKMEGVALVRALSGLNFNIALNTKVAPTDDVHVRRAMAYAMDYQSAIDNIYLGSVKATGPIVQGMAGVSLTEAENPYKLDMEKAKAELAKSKYYDDLISGKMPLSLVYCSEGGAQQEKLALLLQSTMASLGIKMDVTGKPFATMMTDASTVETTPNASFVVFAPPYLDGGSFLKTRYHSSSCGSWEQMEWLQNQEIDQMIETAMTIADEETRNTMYKEISLKLVDLCPTIWVADLASSFAYRSSYITQFPIADKYEADESFIYAMAYFMYFRDFKVM